MFIHSATPKTGFVLLMCALLGFLLLACVTSPAPAPTARPPTPTSPPPKPTKPPGLVPTKTSLKPTVAPSRAPSATPTHSPGKTEKLDFTLPKSSNVADTFVITVSEANGEAGQYVLAIKN